MSSSSRSMVLMATKSCALLALFGEATAYADEGRFASVADVLTSPEFIEDCIGRDGGTVLLSFSPTYREERLLLAAALRQQLLDTGAAEQVLDYDPTDWSTAASCDMQIPPGPRAVVFVRLLKDENGVFQVARVLVRTKQRCEKTSLERGYYPDRCSDARVFTSKEERAPSFARQGLAVPTPAKLRPAAPPNQERARDRVTGLLTGVVIQAGMVLGMRIAQAGIVREDPESAKIVGIVAYSSTLGLATLSAYTAKSWVLTVPPPRRRRIALGLAGAALVSMGSAVAATVEINAYRANGPGTTERPGLRLLQAFGEFSAAAGVGLVTFAVHRRVSLSPSMAGVTISGRF